MLCANKNIERWFRNNYQTIMEIIEIKEQDETGTGQNIWTNQNTYTEIISATFLVTFPFIPNKMLFL